MLAILTMFGARFMQQCRRMLAALITLRRRNYAIDWRRLRGPLVDDDVVLQSPTHLWLRDLSRAVHPTRLCRHHPRIANRIAKHWPDPKRTEKLLHDLMVDRRGNRRGFPPRIAEEIDRLYRHNAGRLNPMLRRAVGQQTPLHLVSNSSGPASVPPSVPRGPRL
jgi:hypothetical protein